jgi:hypothetical protein
MANENKKTVLICWNDGDSGNFIKAQIEKLGCEAVICQKFPTLKNTDWSKITYIIVLCELRWSDEVNEGAYSDMNGIKLVQHYIRSKKKIKLPILFLSMLSRNFILNLKDHSDKEIISTPALQHYFLDVLSPEGLDILKEMRELSTVELEYSLLYCAPRYMLAKFKHDISQYDTIDLLIELVSSIKHRLKETRLKTLIQPLNDIKNNITNNSSSKSIGDFQNDIYLLCCKAEKELSQ